MAVQAEACRRQRIDLGELRCGLSRVASDILWLMSTRYDVSEVPPQGGYIAKRCPVRIQNDMLRPAEPLPAGEEARLRMEQGVAFEREIFARSALVNCMSEWARRSIIEDYGIADAGRSVACPMGTQIPGNWKDYDAHVIRGGPSGS